MESPFEQNAPTDILDRVREFARDLAYGATLGLWHTRIQWRQIQNPEISNHSKIFAEHLRPKWGTDFPSEYLLLSFGYITEYGSETGYSTYLLTDKAFQLLEQPSSPPDVFISYRRSESSAFGLLIEARLRLAGNPNPFIDKNLVPGSEWNAQLKQQIQRSRYFIALIGKTTLASPYVIQEIEWAAESNCTIISVLHNGADMDDSTPEILKRRHAISVTEENALGYETAVNQLLNSLGYSTY
jgi:hypothetical protein